MLLTAALVGPVRAQVPDQPSAAAGFDAGPCHVTPLVDLTVEHTDNVLYRSSTDPQNVRPSLVLTGLGGAILDVPFSQSLFRVAVAQRERNYSDDPNSGAFYGVASARFAFGGGAVLTARDDYEDGEVDAQTYRGGIPGVPTSGEIVFTGEPYWRNLARVENTWGSTGHRQLGVRYERDDLRFQGDRSFGFFDLASDTLEVHGRHATGSATGILWSAEVGRDHLDRPDSPPPVGGGDPTFPAESSRQTGYSVKGGWERGFGSGGHLALRSGLTRVETVGTERSTQLNVVGSAEYMRDDPRLMAIAVGAYRNVFPSPFTSGEVFVSTSTVVTISRAAVFPLVLGGQIAATRNNYEATADAHLDDVYYVQGWIGYRWTRGMQWRVFASRTTRQSSDPQLDFEVNKYGTSLLWGF